MAIPPMPIFGATNLGIGHRAPVMQNGQVPGMRRQYDTNYAMVLEEIVMRRVNHYRRRTGAPSVMNAPARTH